MGRDSGLVIVKAPQASFGVPAGSGWHGDTWDCQQESLGPLCEGRTRHNSAILS